MTSLMSRLQSDRPPQRPFYYVAGSEAYLIDEARRWFLSKTPFGPPSVKDFNFEVRDGSKDSASRLIAAGESPPLNAEKRLVFCREAQALKDTDWKDIILFMDRPPPFLVMVFFFEKADKRRKYFKELARRAEEISAAPVREWERAPWIRYMARKEGLSFSASALALFERLSGSCLLQLSSEIKKLKVYLGSERSLIEEKDVLALIGKSRQDTVFDLAAAVAGRDKTRALQCLFYLLDHGQSEVAALAMTARHFRIIARLREGERRLLPRERLAAFAGVPPFFLPEYSRLARLWTKDRLTRTMEDLFKTEKALKSSPLASLRLAGFILRAC